MTEINDLINKIAADEQQLYSTQFIAPCVRDGKVRTRMSGLVYTFTPKPQKFEGWGIFKPINAQTAEVIEEAILPETVMGAGICLSGRDRDFDLQSLVGVIEQQ